MSDVSFALRPGQTLGLVGESGCGKSVTAQTLMRLLPTPPARIDAGRILFAGEDLVTASERRLRALRGDRLAMIFQEPMTSLNPTFTVGSQIERGAHTPPRTIRAQARAGPSQAFAKWGWARPRRDSIQYPHELSGGIAATGDDRHGARLPSGTAHRRRADNRARCDGAGADPGASKRNCNANSASRSSSSRTILALSLNSATTLP